MVLHTWRIAITCWKSWSDEESKGKETSWSNFRTWWISSSAISDNGIGLCDTSETRISAAKPCTCKVYISGHCPFEVACFWALNVAREDLKNMKYEIYNITYIKSSTFQVSAQSCCSQGCNTISKCWSPWIAVLVQFWHIHRSMFSCWRSRNTTLATWSSTLLLITSFCHIPKHSGWEV